MFRSINNKHHKPITIDYEGKTFSVQPGTNVAAMLLEAGIYDFRKTPKNNAKRGPYCMMGVCFDCLVVIDGVENQQACMVEVKERMRINRQDINNLINNE